MRSGQSGMGTVYGLALVGLALVVLSLAGSVVASFSPGADLGGAFTLANFVELAQDPKLFAVLGATLALGAGTVLVMLVFAFPIAWLLARTDFAWKGALFTLLTAKIAIPGFITAMAYVWLFNPNAGIVNRLLGAGLDSGPPFNVYSLPWICFLQGVVLVPAAVFMMLPAFRNLDATLEEAAWVSGVSPARTIRRVVLPLMAPAVTAAGLFFFVIAVEIFDFVGLIGIPGRIDVLSLWIYDATHPTVGLPNYGRAGALGMLLFVITGLAIVLYMQFLRQSHKYAVVSGKQRRPILQELGGWQHPASAFVWVWLAIAFVIPLLTLVWTALMPFFQPPSAAALRQVSLRSFQQALGYLASPFANTLGVMIGAVVLATAASVCICWVVTRSRNRLGRWADVLVFLSPAVPSMVAAVAFQYFGLQSYKLLPLYGTIWLVAIAMGARMLAFYTRTMNAASIQLHYELDEAAYASGVSRFVAFRRIFLPLVAPAIFYSALMVGMLAARELTLPVMMNVGNAHLVATLIYNLQTSGSYNLAAAVGLYMIAALVVLAVAARYLTGMGEERLAAPSRDTLVQRLLRRPRRTAEPRAALAPQQRRADT